MNHLFIMLKGMAMGMAEVIPGVSGGTIAFITGIYARLLTAIKSTLGPEWIKAYRLGGVKEALKTVDFVFLIALGAGMLIGIAVGAFGITWLFENRPTPTWGFFFGLILASIIYVLRQVKQWDAPALGLLLAATFLAYIITRMNPMAGSDHLGYVFLGGMIAISALILPGISGSFILLIMGLYTTVLPAVKGILKMEDFSTLPMLITFSLGCLIGLASTCRFVSWTFHRYTNATLATLSGLMTGSIHKIWPWRNVLEYRVKSSGQRVPFIEENVLPAAYNGEAELFLTIFFLFIGFSLIFMLNRVTKPK